MKGIVMSYTLFVVMMFVSLFMVWMIQYEIIRHELLMEFKTSFRMTMQECTERRCCEREAIETMSEHLRLNPTIAFAELTLMGFRAEPLMLRFELEVKKRSGFWTDRYFINKSMIEEVDTRELP